LFFFHFLTEFVVNLHNLNIKQHILKRSAIYKRLVIVLDVFIIFTFTKKALQIFCAINKYDNDSKEWCFLLNRWLPKTNVWQNKNVTKMGMIMKPHILIISINLRPLLHPLFILTWPSHPHFVAIFEVFQTGTQNSKAGRAFQLYDYVFFLLIYLETLCLPKKSIYFNQRLT